MTRVGRMAGVLVLAGWPALAAAQPTPDFSTSHVEVQPAAPVAGETVTYQISVVNSGADAPYARVATDLPPGAFFVEATGGCGPALDEDRRLVWSEGPFPAGETRTCRLVLLSRPGAAGSIYRVSTAVSTPPSGYWSADGAPELASPPATGVRVGPVIVSGAGLVVLGILGLFAAGIPLVAARARRGAARTAVGAWGVLVFCASFLAYFANMARDDWRASHEFRPTTCTVLDQALDAAKSSGRRSRGSTYAALFALRYPVDGTPVVSSGYGTASRLRVGRSGPAREALARFTVGSAHPCWYDPGAPRTVLLDPRPGFAYLFALLPLLAGVYALVLLRAAVHRATV